MGQPIRLPGRVAAVAIAFALAVPANAFALESTSVKTAANMPDMGDMVMLTASGTSYHMMMEGDDVEVFEGRYTNDHPEPVENIMVRVREYSYPDNMLMNEFYVSAANDYILGTGQSGTYRLELPMSDSVMWKVDGPYAEHGMSLQKDLSAVVDSSSVSADGSRHYFGTVTNDSIVGVSLADIIVSAQEEVAGSFFGTAADEALFDKGTILAPGASVRFELVGIRPDPSALPVLSNLRAQGRFPTMITLSATSLSPAYGAAVSLRSMLDAVQPTSMLTSQTVGFFGRSYRSSIAPVTAYSTWNGTSYSTSVRPQWATRYNAVFEGDSNYAFAVSPPVTLKPKVSLSTPSSALTQTYGRSYTSAGYLKPRHTAGTRPVRVYRELLVGGKWKPYGHVLATASNYSSYSKYAAAIKLPARGKWRLRAVHLTDTYHSGVTTSYRYITVR